jgi:2Fe-2S ferredoxin
MPLLHVKTRSGQPYEFTCPDNVTVMEAIRDAGVLELSVELSAICGGACSCATCHVHFDPESFARLAPMSADEDGLLEGASDRSPYSRLSCQVRLTPAMGELSLQIANDD